MSDTSDEMEAGAALYESYLEEQEERRERLRNEQILISKIDRRIDIAKGFCMCSCGIHDGKRVDCACKICH